MQQAIIVTSDGVVYWRVYTLHALNKLNKVIITLWKYAQYSMVELIKKIFTRRAVSQAFKNNLSAFHSWGLEIDWYVVHFRSFRCLWMLPCHMCWLYMSMHDSSFVFHSPKGWLYVFQRRTAPAAPLPASAIAARAAPAPSAPPRPPPRKPLVGTSITLKIMKWYTLTCFQVFANRKYVKTSKILYIYTTIPFNFLGD